MIRLDGLRRVYDGRPVVDGVSLEVAAEELLVLVGASGSGKTTTLKMINRLVEPSAGRVLLAGEDVAALPPWQLRRRIGYLFQQVGLFPHMTVGENVGVTPSLLGWPRQEVARRVDELLALVELPPERFRDRDPRRLSGGEQQRVGLARALAARPAVLLLDEPFAALDPLTRERLRASFQGIRQRLGLTAVFVTHDMTEALLLADRIAVLHAGRLLQVGSPGELLRSPAGEQVARLVATPRRQAQALAALESGGEV